MKQVLMAIVCMVVGLFLIVYMLIPTTTDVLTEPYSEPFSVNTGAGVTNTTETITYEHWYRDLTSLTATSDNGNDTPVVLTCDEDGYDVTVIGLEASASRVLTINYVRTANQEFTGVSGFYRIIPFLLVVALFGIGIYSLFSAVKTSSSRRG